MSPRASWKGFLKIADVTVPVGLYAAASTSERIALHTINRPTGHRVRREFVDAETGEAVDRDEQVKGYEVAKGEYVSVEPDEIAAVIPHGDKTLTVSAFVDFTDVDDLYFDKPYYLGPSDRSADETFGLVREGMRAAKVAAVAEAVLFRRARTVLIRALDKGLVASTLNYDYEVRSAGQAFSDIPAKKITGEMLDLAVHIIKTKQGAFDPREFQDRYEDALADLVKLKVEGKAIPKRAPPPRESAFNLMQALRDSAAAGAGNPPSGAPKAKKRTGRRAASKEKLAPPRRKAG
ncbi:MAG: Ku protein [Hyphomicrobiales bacterium]|nr:Ku protein [Hyphomicrobiales bacterium]